MIRRRAHPRGRAVPIQVALAALTLLLVAAPNALAAPTADLSHTMLTFTAPVGTSDPQTVTLTNNGDMALLIQGISVNGPDAARFERATTCALTLSVGSSCTVTVTFTPVDLGVANAQLEFDFFNADDKAVTLTGTGTAAPPPPPPLPAPQPPSSLDPDGDGVLGAADRCPNQRGIPADGCPDRDGDGISDRVDRCLTAPGDLANGCQRELNAEIRGIWRVNERFTKLLSLVVRTRVNSRIDIRCQGKRGVCRFSTRAFRRTTQRTTSLTRLFGKTRVLPAGTTITVRVTHRGRLGTYERLRTRTGRKLPSVKERCINHLNRMIFCP